MQKQKTKTKGFSRKLGAFIKHPFVRKNKPMLHTVEWIFILLAFFALGFLVISSQNDSAHITIRGGAVPENRDTLIETPEENKLFTGETLPEPIDTTSWDTYQNKWYGFEIGHPDSWENNTQYRTATEKSAVYETIYKFRKDGDDTSDVFEGFDVRIYPLKKVPSIEVTNDIHKKKGFSEGCSLPKEEIKLGEDEKAVTFEKISVDENNPCFDPAFFYSATKGDYLYNIVPAVGKSGERFSDPEKETTNLFPEYKEAAAAFKLIPIVRPKPKPDPRVGVKKPVSAKIVNGKLVCAKKNDKPKKSDKNKPGHLDLECCLDPDETPNPWCSY